MKPERQQLVGAGNVLPIVRPPRGSAPVPTLDEVADRPEIVSQLSRAALMTMLYRAMGIQQACFGELVAGQPEREVRESAQDDRELLTASEVARMMGGISPRQVYRQAKQFPFNTFTVRPTPGTVRFHRRLVEQFLRDPDAYRVRHARAVAPESGAAVSRLGRRSGSA